MDKIHGEYVSREYITEADNYMLQDEDDYYNWDHVNIDAVKTE